MTDVVGLNLDVLAAAYDVLPDPALGCDAEGNIVWCNKEALDLIGRDMHNILGTPVGEVVPAVSQWLGEADFRAVARCGELNTEIRVTNRCGDDRLMCCRCSRLYASGDDTYIVLLVLRDITEWGHLEEHLRNLSLTDELTGLYNRRYLNDVLHMEEDRARRFGFSLGILFIDVDDFKGVNDSFGHDAGDRLLLEIGHRLTNCCRKIDIVCRWGGDEFVVAFLAREMDGVRLFLERIRRAVTDEPVDIGPLAIPAVISGGAAFGLGGTPGWGQELLRQADALLLEAKRSGKNQLLARNIRAESLSS